jgi:hypothetical protein
MSNWFRCDLKNVSTLREHYRSITLFPTKFVLSCLPQNNLVSQKENFLELNSVRVLPKTIFDYGAKAAA